MKKKFFLIIALSLIVQMVFCQDFYDIDTVNTIEIIFSESNWDEILDNLYAAGNEERLVGTAIINGVQFDSVGVRYKGNSSYRPDRIKNPLNIKLDYILEDQLLDGYGTLKLANCFKDPSFIREALSYEIAGTYLPTSNSNFTNVYINGDLIGLYSSVQDVDKFFMNTHFNYDENARIKGELTGGPQPVEVWGYAGSDSSLYYGFYELESDSGWNKLVNFLDVFNNSTEEVETVLNVDRHLWMLAFDILMVNLDAPVNFGHNFYLFEDSSQRFNPILWDLNENFGAFTMLIGGPPLTIQGMQHLDPFLNISHPNYPIINKILPNPTYRKMYIAHMKTIIEDYFSNDLYLNRALEIQDIIDESVQADPNKFYTYNDFLNNIYNQVGYGPPTVVGIAQLMDERVSFILNHPLFQEIPPIISNIGNIPATIVPNTTVWFSAEVEDAETVILGYKQNIAGKFEKTEMFDDGNHNDGVAGDEIYGVSIIAGYSDIHYCLYAENDGAGIFSPARAEYEFYTLDVVCETGNVVINEINYHSADDFNPEDWVEFYNAENDDIDISGWCFKDENDEHIFTFPVNTVIESDGYLVLCKDSGAFSSLFPGVNNFIGDMDFGLSGGGEWIRLYDAEGVMVDSLEYDDEYPWPTEPDGNGPTLELIDHTLDNTLPSSWAASEEHGTPGTLNSAVSVENNEITPSVTGKLYQNYPNPFNPSTTISYQFSNEQNQQDEQKKIEIYNLKGQKIRQYSILNIQSSIVWDGTDENNQPVSSGVYFYQLKAGNNFSETKRMLLLK